MVLAMAPQQRQSRRHRLGPGMVSDKMPEPPDLQKLIKKRGGYGNIIPQDWILYDKQLSDTQSWLRDRHNQVKSAKS